MQRNRCLYVKTSIRIMPPIRALSFQKSISLEVNPRKRRCLDLHRRSATGRWARKTAIRGTGCDTHAAHVDCGGQHGENQRRRRTEPPATAASERLEQGTQRPAARAKVNSQVIRPIVATDFSINSINPCGASLRPMRVNGYTGPMQDLPRRMAIAMYEMRHW